MVKLCYNKECHKACSTRIQITKEETLNNRKNFQLFGYKTTRLRKLKTSKNMNKYKQQQQKNYKNRTKAVSSMHRNWWKILRIIKNLYWQQEKIIKVTKTKLQKN